jgi:hypothetical protein
VKANMKHRWAGVLALLVSVLAMLGAPVATASEPTLQDGGRGLAEKTVWQSMAEGLQSMAGEVPEYELQANPEFSTLGDAYIDTDELVDAAGNRYVAVAEGQPGNSNITFLTLRKIAPGGAVTTLARFYPTNNQKIDKATLSRSGRGLIVSGITHEIVNTKPRVLERQDAIVDVGFVTTPTVMLEEGGPGAFTGGGQPPQSGGCDETCVERVVRRLLGLRENEANLVQAISGDPNGSIRQGIEDKAKDAVRELNMWSLSMQVRGIDQWERDRVYEVLRQNGLLATPTPVPVPTPPRRP